MEEKETAEGKVKCSYCGHSFDEHNIKDQGFWACNKDCVCVMFKDGQFPVPISSWQI